MTDWFNPGALFIMFREALEAAVIIAVLLQMMNKLHMPQLKRFVWIGAMAGVAISIVIGVVFIVVFYVANNKLFSGTNGELIFKGCVNWLASLMITVVALAMLKFYNLERKWRHKLEGAAKESATTNSRSHKWSIMILAGSATLREGIESVMFLTGVSQGDGVRSIIIPGIIGVVLGLAVGVLLYYSGKPIKSLKWFFFLSCGLLLLISSGLVVTGTGNFQAAGLFGALYPYEYRPWSNKILWDTSGCCSDQDGFWAVIKALFGYTDQPTNLQLLYYCLYWFVVVALMTFKYLNGTLTDRRLAEQASMISRKRMMEGGVSSGKLDVESKGEISSEDLGSDVEAGAGQQSSAPSTPTAPTVPQTELTSQSPVEAPQAEAVKV